MVATKQTKGGEELGSNDLSPAEIVDCLFVGHSAELLQKFPAIQFIS